MTGRPANLADVLRDIEKLGIKLPATTDWARDWPAISQEIERRKARMENAR